MPQITSEEKDETKTKGKDKMESESRIQAKQVYRNILATGRAQI